MVLEHRADLQVETPEQVLTGVLVLRLAPRMPPIGRRERSMPV